MVVGGILVLELRINYSASSGGGGDEECFLYL